MKELSGFKALFEDIIYKLYSIAIWRSKLLRYHYWDYRNCFAPINLILRKILVKTIKNAQRTSSQKRELYICKNNIVLHLKNENNTPIKVELIVDSLEAPRISINGGKIQLYIDHYPFQLLLDTFLSGVAFQHPSHDCTLLPELNKLIHILLNFWHKQPKLYNIDEKKLIIILSGARRFFDKANKCFVAPNAPLELLNHSDSIKRQIISFLIASAGRSSDVTVSLETIVRLLNVAILSEESKELEHHYPRREVIAPLPLADLNLFLRAITGIELDDVKFTFSDIDSLAIINIINYDALITFQNSIIRPTLIMHNYVWKTCGLPLSFLEYLYHTCDATELWDFSVT